jgi:hypothetical protein
MAFRKRQRAGALHDAIARNRRPLGAGFACPTGLGLRQSTAALLRVMKSGGGVDGADTIVTMQLFNLVTFLTM